MRFDYEVEQLTIPERSGESELDSRHSIKPDILIYPNPARHHLNIYWSRLKYGIQRLQLTDLRGLVHYRQEIEAEMSNVLNIPLEGIAPGVYFITLTGAKGKRIVKRVIITR